MVDFAGWEMPLHYGSIIDEHHATRNGATLFDVSHMGRVRFSGRHARRFLERVFSRRISNMKSGTCRYGFICNEQGGVKDDVLVYRFDDHWMMVCNAANREKLLEHFEAAKGDLAVKVEDQTEKTAMVALQGPKAMEIIGQFSSEIPTLKRFHFRNKNLMVLKMTISRTGYTGEDGVEVILPANMVNMALKLLMRDGGDQANQLTPAGLGCRDTLRLEAALPLYGHELSEDIDALASGYRFAISLDKDQDTEYGEPEPFIGQDALKKIDAEGGPSRLLTGLKLEGKRTPRQDMAVLSGDDAVGTVTSGCLSPTRGYPIALAYVDRAATEPGTNLTVDFGRKTAEAEIVELPFYKPPKG
jgi:aminomethyltransferase